MPYAFHIRRFVQFVSKFVDAVDTESGYRQAPIQLQIMKIANLRIKITKCTIMSPKPRKPCCLRRMSPLAVDLKRVSENSRKEKMVMLLKILREPKIISFGIYNIIWPVQTTVGNYERRT